MISIVTATYNREILLYRLYESLKNQIIKDFEWIIIDDGSVDNTENVVKNFINEADFLISYVKKENAGKHSALNVGISIAKYDYIFFVDSDDALPNSSIYKICEKIKIINNDVRFDKIAGVCGSKSSFKGELTGSVLENDLVCNYLDFRYKYNITGDKAEIFKTSILRDFEFPTFSGEKFCPEALVWNRIAVYYDMFFFNDIIYHCEYLKGGLTDRIFEIRKDSPNATLLYYKELFEVKNLNLFTKYKALLNFWRFYEVSDNSKYVGALPESYFNFFLKMCFKIKFFFK